MNFADPMSYVPILPELALILASMVILMAGAFARSDISDGLNSIAAFGLIAVAVYVSTTVGTDPVKVFSDALVIDDFARVMKVLILGGAGVAMFMSHHAMRELGIASYEYAVLILLSVVGMLVMASANTLLALYMGLELQSFALYVVAALRRDAVRSGEAGLKYFVLGALSSGLLLYGLSLIYGFTGTTNFDVIATQLQGGSAGIGLIFGLVFMLAGLAFKISAVPFHMWTPDVYEGAPTPITAFFAAAPKVAAFALLTRIVLTAFPAITPQWQQVIIFVSIASMSWGAFAAIGQTNIKRLMAYSSIGHMGFALVGLAAANAQGVQGVVIYLVIYVIMTLGTFACILSMKRGDESVEEISDLAGLAQTNLPMAALLAVLMFSLAGIPPLAGFLAKFYVFLAAVEAGLYPLALIGVIASVVGCVYYLNIIKVMFFDEPADAFEPMASAPRLVLGLSGIAMIALLPLGGTLVQIGEAAARSFF